jgi:predicted nuclease of predicted toxin-antitoxin system
VALTLYVDECVDARIIAGLRRRGVDLVTAGEQGLLSASDAAQMERAVALGRALVTADQDFLVIVRDMHARGAPFPGVFLSRGQRPSAMRFATSPTPPRSSSPLTW